MGAKCAAWLAQKGVINQGRAWRSPDNEQRYSRCAAGPAGRQQGRGRRTSGVGDQAMGGLISNAAGALCKGAGVWRRCALGSRVAGVETPGAASMAEWQISQAEHVACSCGWHSADASVQWLAGSAAVLWRLASSWVACWAAAASWWCAAAVGVIARGCSTPAAMAVPVRPRRTSTTMRTKKKPRRMAWMIRRDRRRFPCKEIRGPSLASLRRGAYTAMYRPGRWFMASTRFSATAPAMDQATRSGSTVHNARRTMQQSTAI